MVAVQRLRSFTPKAFCASTRLKAPSSAEFPVAADPSYVVVNLGNNRHRVSGWLSHRMLGELDHLLPGRAFTHRDAGNVSGAVALGHERQEQREEEGQQ